MIQSNTSNTTTQPTQPLSMSRSISAWKMVFITVVKDLQIIKRYIPNLLGKLVELGIRVLFFLLLSNIITVNGAEVIGRDIAGSELFIFFQGALLLFVFNSTALQAPVNAVNRDLYNGTLEFLYTTPPSRYAYFVGTILAEAIVHQVIFLPLYIILVVYSQVSVVNMLFILLACFAVLGTLVAFGVMIALLGLLWRQVGSITAVLGIAFELLAGAYFPVAAFPQFLQYIAYLLPYTWGYDLVRYYSFEGNWQTILPVWAEWTILLVFAIVYTILSSYFLKKVEKQVKKQGLHLL